MPDHSSMEACSLREAAMAQLLLLQLPAANASDAAAQQPYAEAGLCLRLAPDQWLLLAETEPFAALSVSDRAKLTDISHAWIRLRISGPKRWEMLSKCMALPHSLGPAPYAVRTLCVGVPVILLETSETEALYLLMPRSYSAWLTQWLADAATEYVAPSLETAS